MSDDTNENINNTAGVEITPEETKKLNATLSDSPDEMATVLRVMYLPKFLAGVAQLSSRARTRLLNKLVSGNLEDKEYVAQSKLEADLYAVADRLIEARFLITMSYYGGIIEDEHNKELKEGKE